MKFLRTLRCDLEKTIVNPGFLGAVILISVLCFTASAYSDVETGKTYSVFEAIFNLDRGVIQADYTLSNVEVFSYALSGYITMFLPIIVAFPFMVSFCAERNSGFMRYTITRTGQIRYCASKFMASFLSGGLVTLFGVLLYGMIVWNVFPDISSYQIPEEELMTILSHGIAGRVMKTLLASFLYGAVTTVPAFFIGSFCRNPYLITCLPFLIVYIWDTALMKLGAKGIENLDFDIYDKIGPFFPYGMADIVNMAEWNTRAKTTLLFNGVYFLLGFAGFCIVICRRTDKGV